jgi:hypothetical protein
MLVNTAEGARSRNYDSAMSIKRTGYMLIIAQLRQCDKDIYRMGMLHAINA